MVGLGQRPINDSWTQLVAHMSCTSLIIYIYTYVYVRIDMSMSEWFILSPQ